MGLRVWIAALLALTASAFAPASAEPFRSPHVETELVSARAAATPGETVWIALRQDIIPGWHTYWRNPGDSGESTEIAAWRLPAGYSAGDLNWPAPEAIPFDVLMNYGYAGEVLFPIQLKVPANAVAGSTAQVSADVTWLVCSDICVPEQGTLSLALPIAASGRDDPRWAGRIAATLAALPKPDGVTAHIAPGAPAHLSVAFASPPSAIRNPAFFPYSRDAIAHAEPQTASFGAHGVTLALKPGADNNLGQSALSGVLTFEAQDGPAWTHRAVEINAAPGAILPETSGEAPPAEAQDIGLPLALAFAFLGGLILNVMPCVLPVLAIKALSFAGGAHAGEARRHGLAYLGGVILTFLVLAGILIALRGAGQALGWGFQLQSPLFAGALALLFFTIGLNFAGLFAIGGSAQNFGQALATRKGEIGAFFTGALAVIAAAPCTAPFMAAAAGYAFAQTAPVALSVFLALALGFAAPILALSFAPSLQRLIPKPGPWMERARNVLAFPMFAAAIWLVWVTAEQAGAKAALALMSLAAAIVFVLYVARWGRAWIIAGALVCAGTAAFAAQIAWPAPAAERLAEEPWSVERVAALRAEGRPVFVDFTAAWCITCQVNKTVALNRPRVIAAMRDHNVAFLTADWTNKDQAIAAELARFDRAGVPLYLYYPPSQEGPRVLPQILTEDTVLQALGGR